MGIGYKTKPKIPSRSNGLILRMAIGTKVAVLRDDYIQGVSTIDRLYNSSMTKIYTIFIQSILPLLGISLVCHFYKNDLELLNIAMLYLLPILYTAIRHGQMTTLIISIIATLLFDVLFIPPFFELSVHNAEYLLSFAIMIVVGQLVSYLAMEAGKSRELETSDKLYSAVLGSLSHELRTPLAVVIGSTSTILSRELELSNQERSELCENAYTSAKQMQELIENLLTSARFESGGVKPVKHTCSVAEIVSSALIKAEKKHDQFADFSVEDDLPSINSDAVLLEQAFYNIIDNAFKYGQSVKVAISCSGNDIFVNISNNGTLPKDAELHDIGSKFVRLSNSTSYSGTGLGLFISKRIFEVLDATFDVYIQDKRFFVKLELR